MNELANPARSSAHIRVLVIDDEPAFTQHVKQVLERTGLFEVCEEHQARQALATALAFKPDVVLVDVIMPDLDGGRVAGQLRAHAALRDVPVIFLTVLVSEEHVRTQHGVMDGERVMAKPVRDTELLERIVQCLAERPASPAHKPRILVIDDEAEFTRVLRLNIEITGRYEVVEENLETCALTTARFVRPDLILVDMVMPQLSGTEVIAQLRSDAQFRDIPVVLMTALLSSDPAEGPPRLIEGVPCLAKPFSVDTLLKTIDRYLKQPEAGVTQGS